MFRWRLTPVLLAGLVVAGAGCGPDESGSRSRDPGTPSAGARSVLLLTVDTLRHDALGFAGNDAVATPTLDRLAATGRVFERAYAHNTLTLPSHANMLTGLYPYQHGLRENAGFTLSEEIPTLATVLSDAGFATAAVVAAFPLDARFGLDRGFDLYDDRYPDSDVNPFRVSQRPGDRVVPQGVEWWREHAGERRLLWLHLFDPHAPYDPPPEDADAPSPYLGEVQAADRFLAQILGPLLEDDPGDVVVVFVADHGEGLGDHGEETHGIFAYDSTLRVPLVVWGPGVEPGRDDRLARHVDLLPTLLEAAGVEPPADLPGRSLLAPPPSPAAVTTSYFEALTGNLNRGWAPLRGIVRGHLKYIDLPIPELYDLAADPGETENLAESRRGAVRELHALLPAESNWPPPRGEIPDELARNLESLGYLTGSAPLQADYGPEDDPKRLVELDRKLLAVSGAFDARQFETAAAGARALIAARPGMPQGHTFLAQSLLELDRTAEAIEVMRHAVEIGHASDSLERQLGLALVRAGRAEEALRVLDGLAAPDDPASLSALGHALTEAGRPEEGIEALQRALEIDATDSQALERLSAAALALGRFEDARRWAEASLELHPERGWAWNNLGVALFQLGRPEEALRAWERTIEVDPRQFDTLFNLGLVAARMGRTDQARRAFEAFLAGAPDERYAADRSRVRQLLAELPP